MLRTSLFTLLSTLALTRIVSANALPEPTAPPTKPLLARSINHISIAPPANPLLHRDNSDCPGIVIVQLGDSECCIGGATISGHPEIDPTGCVSKIPLTADDFASRVSAAEAKITTSSQSTTGTASTTSGGKTIVNAPGVTIVADAAPVVRAAGMVGAALIAGVAVL